MSSCNVNARLGVKTNKRRKKNLFAKNELEEGLQKKIHLVSLDKNEALNMNSHLVLQSLRSSDHEGESVSTKRQYLSSAKTYL